MQEGGTLGPRQRIADDLLEAAPIDLAHRGDGEAEPLDELPLAGVQRPDADQRHAMGIEREQRPGLALGASEICPSASASGSYTLPESDAGQETSRDQTPTFVTRSRNIGCMFYDEGVRCDILSVWVWGAIETATLVEAGESKLMAHDLLSEPKNHEKVNAETMILTHLSPFNRLRQSVFVAGELLVPRARYKIDAALRALGASG